MTRASRPSGKGWRYLSRTGRIFCVQLGKAMMVLMVAVAMTTLMAAMARQANY